MEDIIKKAKNGDKEAFSDLILSIKTDLYKIANAKLNNEEDVKDAVQTTILKAYTNIGELKEIKYFKTWITKILINQCNTIYRNNEKSMKLTEKNTREIQKEEISDEIEIDFGDIIRELDEKEKIIFKLYYKENLTIKEISKKLQIKERNDKIIAKQR